MKWKEENVKRGKRGGLENGEECEVRGGEYKEAKKEEVLLWFDLILWHINHCRLFNAKSIFIHINSSV